jgi:S1-C subfamily serine protease
MPGLMILRVCACILAVASVQAPSNGQESPSLSVFMLVAWPRYNSSLKDQGTAFFISRDGTALTNSHVVENVRVHPREYDLLAIWRGEFYGATLVCASGSRAPHQSLIRDVAEIRLTKPNFSFDTITLNNIAYATAHRGELPKFPALGFGVNPDVGQSVRALGFGHRSDTPIPYEWSAAGEVTRWVSLGDGTRAFEIRFDRNAEPGHSGSPVLDAQGEVAGILTWDLSSQQTGLAQSREAFDPACR